jgi:two-component system OmpR family sensor kinase
VVDILNREEPGIRQRLAAIREHDEFFTYIVRDDQGRILLQSHAADPACFPHGTGSASARPRPTGCTATRPCRARSGSPWPSRWTIAPASREIQMGLGLPLLIVLPVALLAIVLAVRASLAPVRQFRDRLSARGARDLSPVGSADLPTEIAPVADTMNGLLGRLDAPPSRRNAALPRTPRMNCARRWPVPSRRRSGCRPRRGTPMPRPGRPRSRPR